MIHVKNWSRKKYFIDLLVKTSVLSFLLFLIEGSSWIFKVLTFLNIDYYHSYLSNISSYSESHQTSYLIGTRWMYNFLVKHSNTQTSYLMIFRMSMSFGVEKHFFSWKTELLPISRAYGIIIIVVKSFICYAKMLSPILNNNRT